MIEICGCDGYFGEGCPICTPVGEAPIAPPDIVADTPDAVEARISWLNANPYFGMIGYTDHHAELAAMLRRIHQRAVDAERALATARADALREAAAWIDRPKMQCLRGSCTCWPKCEADAANCTTGKAMLDALIPQEKPDVYTPQV